MLRKILELPWLPMLMLLDAERGYTHVAPYKDCQCCTAGAHRGAHMSVLSPHSMSVSPLTMKGPLLLN